MFWNRKLRKGEPLAIVQVTRKHYEERMAGFREEIKHALWCNRPDEAKIWQKHMNNFRATGNSFITPEERVIIRIIEDDGKQI